MKVKVSLPTTDSHIKKIRICKEAKTLCSMIVASLLCPIIRAPCYFLTLAWMIWCYHGHVLSKTRCTLSEVTAISTIANPNSKTTYPNSSLSDLSTPTLVIKICPIANKSSSVIAWTAHHKFSHNRTQICRLCIVKCKTTIQKYSKSMPSETVSN